MAIDAEVGGANANSYVDTTEAVAYFADRLNSDAWDDAGTVSPPLQEAALISATRRLDQEAFRWSRADEAQALAFPRTGQEDIDGCELDVDDIPTYVKRAQLELAIAMLDDDLLADTGLEGFERVKVGPLVVEPRHSVSAGALPAHVMRYIAHALGASPINFPITRG